ncbi:oxidoreductase, 2OG-Fe(II) oxygenase family [Macrophomina phaseolina MS6]|uniref:Oxidoreductase, 2OG-Fe(II) oxygenase family n=1 Tax=Macrophomina phaseolina (strain MS6) TaxID=1126212 RepID=K2RRD7_MACPH|nr:oxidoreductase, 2OG-Fe(II) oxygenase family [Macrophomina phaseolina MS6]
MHSTARGYHEAPVYILRVYQFRIFISHDLFPVQNFAMLIHQEAEKSAVLLKFCYEGQNRLCSSRPKCHKMNSCGCHQTGSKRRDKKRILPTEYEPLLVSSFCGKALYIQIPLVPMHSKIPLHVRS